MQSARLGIVLLDSGGNIVGGGLTTAQGPIAKGARVLFVAASGFRAIPLSRASTGLISAVPTYLLPR